jgi:hypothetical protein
MNRKNYTILPILILLFLFLFDKLALVPIFQDCCMQIGLEIFFDASKNDEFPIQERIESAVANQKKIAFNFGSSLSYGFYFNKSKLYLEATEKLTEQNKARIKDWDILNFATPGVTVLSHYVRLNQMLDRGLKPNLILVELAPNSFNANSPYYISEITNAVPLSFAFEHFSEIPFEHFRRILISRIFILSHKKIGKPNKTSNLLHGYFQKFIHHYGKDEDSENTPESFHVGKENIGNAFVSQFLLQVLKINFTNYSVAPDLEVYAHLLLAKAKKNNIPIVFWFPALHPDAVKSIAETNTPAVWEKFLQDSKGISSHFVNVNDPNNYCEDFIDPMHMGVSCFAKAFPRFLEKIETYE